MLQQTLRILISGSVRLDLTRVYNFVLKDTKLIITENRINYNIVSLESHSLDIAPEIKCRTNGKSYIRYVKKEFPTVFQFSAEATGKLSTETLLPQVYIVGIVIDVNSTCGIVGSGKIVPNGGATTFLHLRPGIAATMLRDSSTTSARLDFAVTTSAVA